MEPAVGAGLFSPEFAANPYPMFASLRAQRPASSIALPDGRRMWLITRYDDVEAALRDPRLVKDYRNALTTEQLERLSFPEEVMLFDGHMLNSDPPDHTRLRKLVQKAFTPRFVEGLRGRVQQIADQLLDGVEAREAKKGDRRMELIEDYAFPLPITVICEMLGVPVEDRASFREWSQSVVTFDVTDPSFDPSLFPALHAFFDYLEGLFQQKRAHPADDLVTALIRVQEEGDQLSPNELSAMVFLLVIAGHETTVNLIGNGVLALLTHPDQLLRLLEDPSLVALAVEEILRYDGPIVTSTLRFASEDLEIAGELIARGDPVLAVIGSADRDPARFADPDALDINRSDNHHLAFGKGIHSCLGAPLARLEGEIAIATLLRRMPELRLAVPTQALSWRPGSLIRGRGRASPHLLRLSSPPQPPTLLRPQGREAALALWAPTK